MGMPRFETNLSDGPFVKFEDALVMSKTTYWEVNRIQLTVL